jgi:trimethylamine--corrinoid protein Co-methyltransferase
VRPQVTVLGTTLIQEILTEAKRVLAEVGMEIRGPRLRSMMLERGLVADATGARLLFPEPVIDRAIADAPGSVHLYDRDGAHHADLGGDRVHFVPGSSGLKVLDHRDQVTRAATSADFVEYVRLGDGLPNISYLATAFSTSDIEANVSDAWRLYMSLTNSKKPVVSGAFTEHGVPRMAEMMQLFRRDRADLIARPMSIFTVTATGNFRYGEDSCQNLLDCVEAGIPVEIVPVTLMGLIAPVTLVGATVFHVIDVLAGITMAQLIRPGAPVLFGGAPAAFHMKAASSPMAAVEAMRLDLAYVEVAKYLGLPTQTYMALSDAKLVDAQAGAETFGSALLAALAGVNSVSGPGMLDFVLAFSLPKLVFDDEMCGQAKHFVREVGLLEDLPVGPLVDHLMRESHLIMADHTIRHWPQELYLTGPVIDRDSRETWLRKGGKDSYQLACDEVSRRLAAYEQIETPPDVDAEMRALVTAGLVDQTDLPVLPVAATPPPIDTSGMRRQNRRRTNPGTTPR